jgi:site-specific DNA-methyltransferase (adenine-specific)
MIDLRLGDCLEVLQTLPDCSVDAVVTDPPYGLSFMGKKWDYDVPGVEVWAECLRVLKPGGHLLAFAGTRTQHRMAVRIEDAGFEIRDMIAWVYGSGFPKSLDVSKAIDKAAGAERDVVGPYVRRGDKKPYAVNSSSSIEFNNAATKGDITAPTTPEAQQWAGWGTAMKPALEPITVARKPLIGTVAANVLEHGTGAINFS